MAHILVVDDETNIRTLVRKYALFEGHTVDEAIDGLDAIDKAQDTPYDLIILDLMMPNMNGYDACRLIKSERDVPVILLTARDQDFDKYQGFELGADDYVTKPFSPKELMYRVNAILKRTQHITDVYIHQGFSVDFVSRKIIIDTQAVDLSLKEFELLSLLIANKGIALQRDTILNKVWGYDFFGDDRTLDTHIKRLRKKLGNYNTLITTLRGVGYRFDGE
ncbi:response regulator transcription factor [Erysipelothrix sp. HDW6C]|uniref:response regulator transcription factor n=1 Tax=Erysipelothrix sp. HDW6C TaxID=2714930 RepID=UPI00140874D8|nr:response regulator transcription factor [Erysipelothrix sp. HDW6C]QIK69358.1 response regulator transcription factor [Erysipelothrix sp. HDW6C]